MNSNIWDVCVVATEFVSQTTKRSSVEMLSSSVSLLVFLVNEELLLWPLSFVACCREVFFFSGVFLHVWSVFLDVTYVSVFDAVRHSDLQTLRLALLKKTSPDVRDRYNKTPMMYAAASGRMDSAMVLHEFG